MRALLPNSGHPLKAQVYTLATLGILLHAYCTKTLCLLPCDKVAENNAEFAMTAGPYEVDQNGSHKAQQQQPTDDSGMGLQYMLLTSIITKM